MTLAFLDIESTSLFADTGMLVCAILRREGKDAVFFVGSPRREKKVLERLFREIRKCDCLLTFNGRSFDLPFLSSRALILGLEDVGPTPTCHVDIYEQCKRILRFDRLGLDHIARLLGVDVDAGISGREVPHLYLTYLSGRSKEIKDRIVEHCESDINILEKVWAKLEPLVAKEGPSS